MVNRHIIGRVVKKSCHYYEILIKDLLFTIYKVYYLGNERLKELIMGRFTETVMERVEDSLHNRKKPMVVKLNSEQLEDFIQKFPEDGEFFGLSYHIHDDKTVTFNYNSDGRLLEVLNLVK